MLLLRAIFFSLGTLLSRITGLAREIVLARCLGGGPLLDAFYVAYRIPHLLRDMLAEGALGSSFTKNYSSEHDSSPQSAHTLALQLIIITTTVTSCLCAVGILGREQLVYLMTSQTPRSFTTFISTTETLTALFLPFMMLSSVGALVSSILYQQKRFFWASLAPIFVNLGTVGGAFLAGDHTEKLLSWTSLRLDPLVFALAVGTLIGGIGQLIWLWFPIRGLLRNSWSRARNIFRWHPRVRQVWAESLPMMLAAGIAQLQLIINTNFATSLPPGSTSWLSLSFRVFQLPVGLFAVALAATLLPQLSVQYGRSQGPSSKKSTQHSGTLNPRYHLKQRKDDHLSYSLQATLWIMALCATIMMITSDEIITLLFFGGSFDARDTEQTAAALKAYAPGILGFGTTKILLTYYYATARTSFVLKTSILCLIISTLANLIIIRWYAHVGLAGVMSGMLTVQALILAFQAQRSGAFIKAAPLLTSALTSVALMTIVGITGYIWLGDAPAGPLSKITTLWIIAARASCVGIIFITSACVFYKTSPIQAWYSLKRMYKKRK